MEDHLFDKRKLVSNSKNKEVIDILKHTQNFEQELVNYLKIGLIGRQKQFKRITNSGPSLDMVFNLLPNTEMEKFG